MAPDRSRPARFAGHEYPQTLPEPDDIQTGALAPWSTLSTKERTGLTLELVESRLRTSRSWNGCLVWKPRAASLSI